MVITIQGRRIPVKYAASAWIIGLALINIIMTALNNKLGWADLLILGILSIPALVNRRALYLLTGIAQTLLGCFMLVFTVVYHMSYLEHGKGLTEIWAGYFISTTFLFASLMYLFTGMEEDGKTFGITRYLLSGLYIALTVIMFAI